jgi:hypothetical protein
MTFFVQLFKVLDINIEANAIKLRQTMPPTILHRLLKVLRCLMYWQAAGAEAVPVLAGGRHTLKFLDFKKKLY